MIDGIGISGYRSFASESAVRIDELSKINVFIGKNNCGKSNVLRFVRCLPEFLKGSRQIQQPPKLDQLDYCLGDTARGITVGVRVKKGCFSGLTYSQMAEAFAKAQVKFSAFGEALWFDYKIPSPSEPTAESLSRWQKSIKQHCDALATNRLTGAMCGYTQGTEDKRATDIALKLHEMVRPQLTVRFIDAFRRIAKSGEDELSGAGLIQELRRLQSPELPQYEASKHRFAKIVGFVRTVLGNSEAQIEIPAEKDEIYVTIDKKLLPLQSLGTGIHELIILASAVTVVDNVAFCVEEPEIHLHPELQRKFARYIAENTKNQYLIASHSNAFIDLPGVSTYRCWLEAGHTRCELASRASDKHAILLDLGYRPSDLLQANYVIWVEGPSDRVYINHWIAGRAPELVEGLHYAIMFYGGRLLSHLSYDEPSTSGEDSSLSEFIHLARLNRDACIVMDSDRAAEGAALNQTKQRIISEFEKDSCLAWVTDGRTIENYVPEDLLNRAIQATHPRTGETLKWGPFEDLTRRGGDKRIDKVAVAHAVAKEKADFTLLSLDSVTDRLIERIKQRNPE